MSHLKERAEKNCLNCNAIIYGRFCHVCGQENIEPKESVWHLVNHFVEDITHFDGKFFSTLKYLIFKPGFLSHEYLKGRRADYLHPIRMYVFTSAIFFLVFFSFVHTNEDSLVKVNSSTTIEKDVSSKKSLFNSATDSLNKPIDSIKNRHTNNFVIINGDTVKAKTLDEYEALQKKLPKNKRDNFFQRIYAKRSIIIAANLSSGKKNVYQDIITELIHNIPKMMFIFLPIVALILKLLYIRKKDVYYINHAIFVIHLFIGIYIIWLGILGVSYIKLISGYKIFSYIGLFLFFFIFFYIYKSMRNFYEQRRAKTVFKFLLFNFIIFVLFLFISTLFFINVASEKIH